MENNVKPIVPTEWWTRPGPEVFLENTRRLLPGRGRVLDFGAGRGKYRGAGRMEQLIDFRGQGREVVGFDPDRAVLGNPFLHHAEVADDSGLLPFADHSFDLIVSLAVFEHIERPVFVAQELDRVLKPGGWLCALTPHGASYVAVGARAVPNRLHAPLLRILQHGRESLDVFPTLYRMNTRRRLAQLFPGFDDYTYLYSGIPSYTRGVALFDRLAKAWDRGIMGRTLHVFMRKRGGVGEPSTLG